MESSESLTGMGPGTGSLESEDGLPEQERERGCEWFSTDILPRLDQSYIDVLGMWRGLPSDVTIEGILETVFALVSGR